MSTLDKASDISVEFDGRKWIAVKISTAEQIASASTEDGAWEEALANYGG